MYHDLNTLILTPKQMTHIKSKGSCNILYHSNMPMKIRCLKHVKQTSHKTDTGLGTHNISMSYFNRIRCK